jgi:hypothetical protein
MANVLRPQETGGFGVSKRGPISYLQTIKGSVFGTGKLKIEDCSD